MKAKVFYEKRNPLLLTTNHVFAPVQGTVLYFEYGASDFGDFELGDTAFDTVVSYPITPPIIGNITNNKPRLMVKNDKSIVM